MGMSASQARLIQLTARMSDLELEGQQINQQRLNLANQSSAIQEEALKMPVPTAPSTYDFMQEVYTGTDKAGKDVYVGIKDDGTVFASVLTDQQPTLKAKQGTQVSSPVYEKPATEKAPEEPQGRSVDVYYYGTVDNKVDNPSQDVLKSIYNNETSYKIDGNGSVTATAYEQKTVYTKGNDTISAEEYNNLTDKTGWTSSQVNDETKPTQFSFTGTGVIYKGNTRYTQSQTLTKHTAQVGKTTGWPDGDKDANGQPIDGYYADANGSGGKKTKDQFIAAYCSGYSPSQVESMKNTFFADANGKRLEFDDYGNFKDKSLKASDLFVISDTKTKIGDNEARSIEAAKEWGENAVNDLVNRIKNYEQTLHPSKEADTSNWRIVNDGKGNLSAVKIGDDGKTAKSFEEDNDEVYLPHDIPTEDLQTDADGMPKSVKVNGQKITIKKGTELDTDAYKAAEAKYTNEKAEYDHAQEEANTKVKKLQTIDKQLELKLKRLDTERNSLNTEIDAVKKVIQDNTDKSFKTFSG